MCRLRASRAPDVALALYRKTGFIDAAPLAEMTVLARTQVVTLPAEAVQALVVPRRKRQHGIARRIWERLPDRYNDSGGDNMAKSKRKTLPKNFEELLAAGDLAALKAVFAGCELDARGGVFKQSALAFAACPDELTRWLVEQGADLSAADAYGETPLHARAGHWKGDVALLIALGADVNHRAGGRGTPLHRAAAVGNLRT
eukprot:gene1220-1643_t